MRQLAIIDTETTGTDESAQCIEVALAIFDVPCAAVVRSFSSLIRADGNAAEAVNRIPSALLADAPEAASVWAAVRKLVASAECVVAHGAAFDQRFVPAEVTAPKPWICSLEDLAFPRAQKPGESLVKLALAHDLGVATAHRAAVDVDLLARLLTRVRDLGTDLDAFLARGLRPKTLLVVADMTFDEKRNEQAKAAGFRWNQPEAPKRWSRRMPPEDAAALPFETRPA